MYNALSGDEIVVDEISEINRIREIKKIGFKYIRSTKITQLRLAGRGQGRSALPRRRRHVTPGIPGSACLRHPHEDEAGFCS